MATTIFRPTSPTNQNRPKMKISNFCVFCPIWIKFGIWANNGPRITWYKFEMATATFYASQKPCTFRRQTMSVNAILASNFKLMSPIDGPCHSESGSTFNLKFDAVVLEKSTWKEKASLTKNLARKFFPLKFFIGSYVRGGRKKSKSVQDSLQAYWIRRKRINWSALTLLAQKNIKAEFRP